MAKTYVLDRVAADLTHGFTHPAIQRLSSLVDAHPHDLDLRRKLAAVYRRVGNRIQAGRWDYLTIGADARDTRAFERAFPSAAARLRAVHWPYRASEAATTYARRRLAKLMAAAAAEQPRERPDLPDDHRSPGSLNGRPVTGVATGTTPGLVARIAGPRGFVALSQRAGQWWVNHPWRRRPGPVTVAGLVAAPFVVVGFMTVLEWIVQ